MRPMQDEQIVEMAGGQWVGVQKCVGSERLVMFRDPVTGSTCCLPAEEVSVAAVRAKLEMKRAEFRA